MHAIAAVAGLLMIIAILLDGFETIVLPRRASRKWRITRLFFISTWGPWAAIGGWFKSRRSREAWLSFYGPLSLPVLLGVWAAGLATGFALIFFGIGSPFLSNSPADPLHSAWRTDLYVSGTTLFTLGPGDVVPTASTARFLLIVESGVGLGFLAVVIGYLPVLYAAFSRREVEIALLDSRAGSPPGGVELLRRHAYTDGHRDLAKLMEQWERWAAELLESHISYPVLCYFRSQHDNQSWLSAIVAILDASSLLIAGVEDHAARQAERTYAICRHALVDVAQIFSLRPQPAASQRRLADGKYLVLAQELCKADLRLDRSPEAEKKLTELRLLYEGYASALSEYLQMPIPAWLASPERKDNWRTVAKVPGSDRRALEANPFLRPEVLDEHR